MFYIMRYKNNSVILEILEIYINCNYLYLNSLGSGRDGFKSVFLR